jgi:hypothetical protein
MSGLSFVVLTIVAVLSLGAQPAPTGKGKVVNVEIVVDTLANLEKSCKAGSVSPTTVLIYGKLVRHCVSGNLLDHDVDEKKNYDAFQQTLVRVRAGESIRWFSKTASFRVVDVRRHAPILPGAPHYPFLEAMPTAFAKEVTSGGVLDLAYEVVQQYKVSFEIGTPGNRVDPDVVCSM